MFSLPQAFCGTETAEPLEPFNVSPCWRETVLDAAVPAAFLVAGFAAVIFKKFTKRSVGAIRLDDDFFSRTSVDGEDTDSNATTVADDRRSLLPRDAEQRHNRPVIRVLVEFTKSALSAVQAIGFFGLCFYRTQQVPRLQPGPYRRWSILVQGCVWSFVSLVTLALLIRTLTAHRHTSSVRTTHLINNFFVVAFIFGALPRLYDLAFAYTDNGKYVGLHAQYDEIETYGVIINVVMSGLLALFFAIERRNRKAVEYASSGLPICPEKTSSNISLALFSWVDSLIWLGYKRTLNQEDLWELADGDDSASIVRKFRQMKGKKSGNSPELLVWQLLKTFKSELLVQAIWGFIWAMLSYSGPFFVNRILAYVEQPENTPISIAYLYTACLLGGSTLMTTASSQALWIGRRICIRLKGIVMGEVYIKTLKRPDMSGQTVDEEKEDGRTTRGQITNMISVDAQKISEVSAYLHYIYSCPIQIIIGACFLFSLLGWSAIIGLSAFILVIPINAWLSQWFERVQEDLMKKTDRRIALMGELLQGVRIVKFFAWEENMKGKVLDARNVELKHLKRRLHGWVLSMIIWYCTPILITCTTFVVYTKFFGNELTASVAFTALALFNSIRAPLDMFPDMIIALLQCRVSVRRIEKFLNEPEITLTSLSPKCTSSPRPMSSVVHSRQCASAYPIQRSAGGSFSYMASLSHSMGYESFGTFGECADPVVIPPTGCSPGFGNTAAPPVASHVPVADRPSAELPTIGFQNASFRWFPTDEDAMAAGSTFALRNLDIDFPIGKLSIVCGPTGCGKTSAILALLGEMYLYGAGGRAFLPDRRNNRTIDPQTGLTEGIAYVAQQAWLQCDTIRNNILFGQPFEHDRYERVIFACALTRDLEILEAGDHTEVGEKGITLSGGQKQRIALARAIYSRARHVLLDDCLSAVDSHTAKHIFENCLQGDLVRGRTRILVTHHVGLCLGGAAHVVVMADGKVTAQGPPEAVVTAGCLSKDLLEEAISQPESNAADVAKVNGDVPKKKTDNENKKTCGKLITEEGRAEGHVQWSVYSCYLKASGGIPFWVFLIAVFCVTQLFTVSEDFWLRIWARAYKSAGAAPDVASTVFLASSPAHRWMNAPVDNVPLYNANGYAGGTGRLVNAQVRKNDVDVNYYLGVYVLLALAVMLATTGRGLLQFWGSLRASKLLYSQLLDRIINAPIRFFDTTPMGRLMNRFSKDFETIDQQVAGDLGILIMDTLYTLTVLVVITFITPMFAIAAFVIIAIFWAMGMLYLKTSRELKRLEAIRKSPCFSLLDETIVGVTTIRAFGEEKRFINENFKRVDCQIRPFIWLWAANRWLSIRVDIAGALVSFFASCFVISGNMDAGLAGFCLTYALMFTDRVLWVVRFYSVNEMNLNSVERVQEYLAIDQELPAVIENFRPPAAWPEAGSIEVDNLILHYAPDLPPVLCGLTFKVEPGEKVGIVGRTGAGKSTLALAFFRFVEAAAGKIFIDGIDISKLGLRDLRSRLTIIPQDPVLFSGTIRSNLDPFAEHEDSEIWASLRRAHLIGDENGNGEAVSGSTFTSLDAVVSENGANFSQGQRQLLAMARALIKNSKVIIMDEATASVDFETDAKIQKTVKEEFSSSTLLVIAHRLRTVVDYDKIMVLDHGRLVEFGDPYTLMMTPPASEEVLAAESGMKHGLFRSMCERTGGAEFEALLAIARAKKTAADVRMCA